MMKALLEILAETVGELFHILPYFLAGVALEAWIRTKKWHVKIRKTLTRYGFAAIGVATLLGLVSPLCACGILPLTISLLLGGLPLAPAMSLLVASPLMSPAGYALAIKNVGLALANAEIVGGIFMGLYAGVVVHLLDRVGFFRAGLFKKDLPQGDFHDHDYPEEILRCHCSEMFSKKVEKAGHGPVLVFLAKMAEGGAKVGKYLLLGVIVQVVALRYLPDGWIDALLTSPHPASVVLLTLGAVPLHLTQITASAILFGFRDLHLNPSAALALLIGGPVTALPAMAVFLSLFRLRVFFLYLFVCISGTLLVAFAAPFFLR
jgi:uncharacterized membrane protein YraQ (UPF0718 family)